MLVSIKMHNAEATKPIKSSTKKNVKSLFVATSLKIPKPVITAKRPKNFLELNNLGKDSSIGKSILVTVIKQKKTQNITQFTQY